MQLPQVLQVHRIAHEAEATHVSKLTGSLTLATDVSHETAIGIKHGDGRALIRIQVEPARGIEPECRRPREREPLGDIEPVTQAEDFARLLELGVGDELRGGVGWCECDGRQGHGNGCHGTGQGLLLHHFLPVSYGRALT